MLAPTNDWNAYNNFGGRSNYINPVGLLDKPTVNGRQDLVRYGRSTFGTWEYPDDEYKLLWFDRPELGNHIPEHAEASDRRAHDLRPGARRVAPAGLDGTRGTGLRLLEAQLHDGTLDLDAKKVLILSVHPEYWTRRM